MGRFIAPGCFQFLAHPAIAGDHPELAAVGRNFHFLPWHDRDLPPGEYRIHLGALGLMIEEPLTIIPNQATTLVLAAGLTPAMQLKAEVA
jgi:hypothetical protein